jgi:bacterioferritin-associated ferredoxin
MIVCVCFRVSDRLVRERVRDGVSLGAFLEETGAGSACGSCKLAIARVHAGARAEPAPCSGIPSARGRLVEAA